MSWISEEAFRWALDRLKSWSSASMPGRRDKQTLYRLLLLRELGVEKNNWKVLSTTDFNVHCKKWLLVSPESLSEKTGGKERYFVPLSLEYQRATSESNWAIGTMWTRLGTWQSQGIIELETVEQNKRKIRFAPEYVDKIQEKLGGNCFPALALAIFLYREKEINIKSTNVQKDADALLKCFLDDFNLNGDGLDKIFDKEDTI